MNTPGVLRSVPTGKGGAADLDILTGCRHGDRTAWRTLYDRYSPVVHRFLATFGVPPEEREDACQEVFVAVYRSLTHFRGEARLSTWILRVRRNSWSERWQKRLLPSHSRLALSMGGMSGALNLTALWP